MLMIFASISFYIGITKSWFSHSIILSTFITGFLLQRRTSLSLIPLQSLFLISLFSPKYHSVFIIFYLSSRLCSGSFLSFFFFLLRFSPMWPVGASLTWSFVLLTILLVCLWAFTCFLTQEFPRINMFFLCSRSGLRYFFNEPWFLCGDRYTFHLFLEPRVFYVQGTA